MSETRATGKARRAPTILAFDTAGSSCSVAIGRDGGVLAREHREMRHGHAEALLPMIERATRAAGLAPAMIDVIAVAVGPGGFTGIRAGLAAARGLALAANAPLLGVTSFAAVAAMQPPTGRRLLVALDSRREDLYVQLFDQCHEPCTEPAAILPDALLAWIGHGETIVAGDAAEAAAAALEGHTDVRVMPGSAPEALGVLRAVCRWPERADPAARPLYLRPPDVSFPKVRGGTA